MRTVAEQNKRRMFELADHHAANGNKRALTRLAGLSPSDWDEAPSDHGNAPHGARWE